MLTLPQVAFSDAESRQLFPVCLNAPEFARIMGAFYFAKTSGAYDDVTLQAEYQLQEALAFLDTPEEADCFDLCGILERLYGELDGYLMLTLIDGSCGTNWRYPDFCREIADLLATAGETAETLYAAIIAKSVELCIVESGDFPVFPDACALLLEEVGATPTLDTVLTFLDGCGIDVDLGYDWEHTLNLASSQSSFVAWSSTPYANIPAQRTRFSWSSGNGLITTYGTSGEPGASTQRHYLYAKRGFTGTDIRQYRFVVDNPQSQDAQFRVSFHSSGVQQYDSGNLTVPASTTGHIIEFPVSVFADLVSIVITGGSSQNASHAGIKVPTARFRGLGSDPF